MNINPIRALSLFIFGSVLLNAEPVMTSDILPPHKRAVSVELAERLAKPTSDDLQAPADLRNPFNQATEGKIDTVLNRPASDADLLAILADQLKPTGTMGREDSLVLLLKGQKGVKVGDRLTLSFDGRSYTVEVVSVAKTNFSLRFNQTEIVRPIK